MLRTTLALVLALTAGAAGAAGTQDDTQLKAAVREALSPLDPKVNVETLSHEQLVELYLVVRGTQMTYFERRRKIRAVLQ